MKKQRPILAPESYEHVREFLSEKEFEKIDAEMKSELRLPPVPRFELIPGYLAPDAAKTLFDRLSALPGFKFETGSCTDEACHLTVQYGPRQAYNDCVPEQYRVISSGDMPDFLTAEQLPLEEKYDCTFNSCQINLHPDGNSHVFSHKDSNPGHICQISVGTDHREFTLTYATPFYFPFAHVPLASGSLLTFFPKDQHKMQHGMKRSKVPCGMKFSVIFRYIPVIMTKTFIKNAKNTAEADEIRRQRDDEYEAAQITGRERRLALAKEKL
jgi:hypothetical protein